MKHIIIYRGLAVAILLLVASVARAEIVGIKDVSECPTLIQNKTVLLDAFSNLSPTSLQASMFFQADKNRFVFCIDPDTKWNKSTIIQLQTILTNSTAYPVIIYGLKIDSSTATVGQPPLATTGRILLQNLKAENLRGPIVIGGSASMRDSALTCDTTSAGFYPKKVLMVTGTGQTISNVSVSDCNEAIEVSGNSNTLKDITVTFDKTKSGMDGGKGIVQGKGNLLTATTLGATTISGYGSALEMMSSSLATNVVVNGPVSMNEGARLATSTITGTIHVNGNNVIITQNTLAGDPAVQIAKGLTGVKVTQNNFSNVNTIAMDPNDIAARTLLSVEWMGKKVDDKDPTIVVGVGGKLMDQANLSDTIEILRKVGNGGLLSYAACNIKPADKEIEIKKKDSQGNVEVKKILLTEKYFECAFDPSLAISPNDIMRFVSNTPTVSLMSENIVLKDFGDWPTTPGQVGMITDNGALAATQPAETGSLYAGNDIKSSDIGGGNGAPPKSDIPDASDTGGDGGTVSGGNNITSDGVILNNELPSGMAGAGDAGAPGLVSGAAAGCSLIR